MLPLLPLTLAITTSIGAAQPLDLESCVGSWLDVRGWVNALAVPDTDLKTPPIADASAACIILRHRGRTVGIGRASSDETLDQDMIRKAAREAIANARSDEVISNLPENVRRDAGTHLTMELEVAGPVRALLGRTFLEATDRLRPGIDGLALRHEDRWWFQFPSHLRLTNAIAGPDRLYSLALASELSPRQIDTLREQGTVSVYQFDTIHLAQATPTAPPTMLVAGDEVVLESEITPQQLAKSRDALARHILQRVFTTDEGARFLGTYTPSTEAVERKPPSTLDRYLIALALARYASTPGIDDAVALEATVAARQLLKDNQSPESEPSTEQMDPPTMAAWCLAASALDHDASSRTERITTLRDYAEMMMQADDEQIRRHSHDLAMAAAALAIASPDDRDLALATARRSRDVLPLHQQVGLLPWLGWVDRVRPLNEGEQDPDAETDRYTLRLIREQVLGTQVAAASTTEHLDAGGFRLQPDSRGVTAQSLRPAVFLAEMLDDPRYADPERDAMLRAAHRQFLRYLLQLSCRQDVSGSWRQPDRVVGGIRSSTWDASLHPASQAMGLMVLCASPSAAMP